MKPLTLILPALLILLILGSAPAVWGQSEPGYVQITDSYPEDLLSQEDLEDLVAPIALYPDPLIAQILPAATFVDQITRASDFVHRYGLNPRIEDQPWDISVKAVAHYPDVLYMMAENYDWTVALGQAFVSQQQDLMDAIQSLRQEARERGNLYSTSEQQVIYDRDVVRIAPASPEYIYIPVYDPTVVYVERYTPTYPLMTFGMGYTIGAWLNRDCNWRERRVYNHGWRGDGWVRRARPHIHDRRGIYTNRRGSVIHVNERVMQYDIRGYREQLRNDSYRFRERRGLEPGSVWTRPGRTTRERSTFGSGSPDRSRSNTYRRDQSSTVTRPGSTVTRPGSTVTRPGSTVTRPGSTVTRPGSTVTRPGSTVTRPGSTVTGPGSTVTGPGSTVTTPGSTVTTPGATVTTPGSTVTTPGSTVTPPVITTPSTTTRDHGTPGKIERRGSGTVVRPGSGTGEEVRPAGGVWRRQEGAGRGRGTGSEQRAPVSGRGRQSGTVVSPPATQPATGVTPPASSRDRSSGERGRGVFQRSPSAQTPSSRPAIVQPSPSVQRPTARPAVSQPPAKVVVPAPSVQPPASRPAVVAPPVVRPAPSSQPSPVVVQPPAAAVRPSAAPRPDIAPRPAASPITTTPHPSAPAQQREQGGSPRLDGSPHGIYRHR